MFFHLERPRKVHPEVGRSFWNRRPQAEHLTAWFKIRHLPQSLHQRVVFPWYLPFYGISLFCISSRERERFGPRKVQPPSTAVPRIAPCNTFHCPENHCIDCEWGLALGEPRAGDPVSNLGRLTGRSFSRRLLCPDLRWCRFCGRWVLTPFFKGSLNLFKIKSKKRRCVLSP